MDFIQKGLYIEDISKFTYLTGNGLKSCFYVGSGHLRDSCQHYTLTSSSLISTETYRCIITSSWLFRRTTGGRKDPAAALTTSSLNSTESYKCVSTSSWLSRTTTAAHAATQGILTQRVVVGLGLGGIMGEGYYIYRGHF